MRTLCPAQVQQQQQQQMMQQQGVQYLTMAQGTEGGAPSLAGPNGQQVGTSCYLNDSLHISSIPCLSPILLPSTLSLPHYRLLQPF